MSFVNAHQSSLAPAWITSILAVLPILVLLSGMAMTPYLVALTMLGTSLLGIRSINHLQADRDKINYKNDAYDALCREGDSTMDEEKRKEIYAKAEDMVLQDAPFIPIYYQKDVELISKKVSGIRNSAFGHLPHTTTAIQ